MSSPSKVLKKGAYHHGDLRQQLVNAIRILVEEQGATGFSVSEACRRAGVSTAAPYRHFTDRDDMLRAVAIDGKHRMAERFRALDDTYEKGSPEAIGAMGRAYVDFATEEPNVFRLMFGLEDTEAGELKEAGDGTYAVVLEQVAAYFRTTPDDPKIHAACLPLWTFVHGLSFLRIDGMVEALPLDMSLDDIIFMAGERLLGPRPSAH